MKGYDRTWPTAVTAIGLGSFLGWTMLGGLAPSRSDYPEVYTRLADSFRRDFSIEVNFERPTASADTRTPEAVPDRPRHVLIERLPIYQLKDRLRSNPDPVLRRNAAIMLGSSGSPEHVMGALTIAMRSDENAEVRFKAAESLGRLDSRVAIDPLAVAATLDPDLRVREAAVAALGHIGHPTAIPTLLSVVADDPSEDVRAQAVIALMRIGDVESIDDAQRALEDRSETPRGGALDMLLEGLPGGN